MSRVLPAACGWIILLVAVSPLLSTADDSKLDLPAVQPALAIAIAWLFIWYYQLPWYDTMIIALLALYPASRLDYVVTVQLTAGTFAAMPGGSTFEPPLGWLRTFSHAAWFGAVPLVLLAAAAAVLALCVSGAWKVGPPLRAGAPPQPALLARNPRVAPEQAA